MAEAKARLAEVQQSVDQAEADVVRAESDLEFAQQQLERGKNLLPKAAISEADYESRVNAVSVARATLGANKAALRTQRFAVDAAKARVKQIQTQLDDVEINVNVTGTIYGWDGSDWMVKEPFTTGTDASDDISPITVYSKMKTLPRQPNVFEPAGAKEFITEMKNLFYSIATDLQGNPVDAVDAVHTAVQSKADRIVILGHEEQ